MRFRITAAVLSLTCAACVVTAGGAGAAKVKYRAYQSKSGGYILTIPASWQLVPRSQAGVKALAARYAKSKKTAALGKAYAAILASPGGRAAITSYDFQAFAWPADPATPIPTQVSLGIKKYSRVITKKDLPALGATQANAFKSTSGTQVSSVKQLQLPAGPAVGVQAAIPAGGGIYVGALVIIIPHGKRVYTLAFQIDARYLEQATLFPAIAKALSLKPL